MTDEQRHQGYNQAEHCGLNQEAIQQLFDMQPDNQLTPVQMTRRAIFPRWEVIRPAEYNPVDVEDQMIQDILESVTPAYRTEERHPNH